VLSAFLGQHREELIVRCAARAAERPQPLRSRVPHASGIPLFLQQLQDTLEAEEQDHLEESMRISGVAGGDSVRVSQMGISATLHGRELLSLGYSVDEVVHAYGDLCQSVTDLAYELAVPFAVSEFRTLNRSLDNAIASAVTAFSDARDTESEVQKRAEAAARVDVLIHALRSSLATATYAVVAMEAGNLPMKGSTGSVLKKCISAMRAEIGGPTLDEVRATHAAD
jgi:hypothetical protein